MEETYLVENHNMDNKRLEKVIEDGQRERNHEEIMINSDEVEEEVDKVLGSKKSHCQLTTGLEALKKPGRRDWLREVVLSRVIENLVVKVNYLSPGPGDDSRKKLTSYKEIEAYLAETSDSSLTRDNFSLSRKVLSLGDCFEFIRMSQQVKKNIYKVFFKVIEGSSPLSVSCNLCEGKTLVYSGLSWHMKKYHLPDETCQICHHNIPTSHYSKHSRVCDGAGPAPEVPDIPKVPKIQRKQPAQSIYSQFYTELNGNSFLPAKKARVACNLCAGKTVGNKNHYIRHFEAFHMPDQTCTRCGKDIPDRLLKNHMNICNGEIDRSKCQNNSKYRGGTEGARE